MKLFQIWERYFAKQFLAVFFLFLFCFYGLYVLIDYSSRSTMYSSLKFTTLDIAYYYGFTLIQRLDILIPVAMMLAAIKTMTTLNAQNELIALMASGIKLKRLLRPFIGIALLGVALLYLNNEFFLPQALKGLQKLEDAHFVHKFKKEKKEDIKSIPLKGKEIMIYNTHDRLVNSLQDVYWIRSINQIIRMQTLYLESDPPLAEGVEVFKRDAEGKLLLVESLDAKFFTQLKIEAETIASAITDPAMMSISRLFKRIPRLHEHLSDREAKMWSAFAKKILMPWLCLLAVIAPAPFCLRFSRQLAIFYLYVWSMFGLVAFYILINSMSILGENLIIPPLLAIFTPFLLFYGLFGTHYLRKV